MSKIRHQHALAVMILMLLIAAALRLPTLAATPPGPHYDEAANAILAAEIGIGGKRPIFISSYTGKEVLFFYLAGGVMRVVGESVFSLRITAVFVSLLTIAATYWLGVESTRDKRIALLAAGIIAVSFWHLLFSRLGFRAITQPLLQTLTVASLLRGLRREQWRWFIAAGIMLGLTAYTYLAARLFPVLLLIAALPLLLNRKARRQRLSQMVLTGAIGLIVLTPLLLYFVRNPDAFWVRIGQVAPDTAVLSIGESYWRSLLMLVWQGDPYIRFNVPGLPLFGWWWSVMMLVGWLVSWWRWRRYKRDWERFVTILLLLTPFFMILPTALATSEIVPSNLRAIGLMPFIFYLPAMGLIWLRDWAAAQWPQIRPFPLTATILLLTLAIGLPQTAHTYFQQWAPQAELYLASDGDMADVARFLDDLTITDETIYVAALHYQHPTLAFLSKRYAQVKWLPQSQALVFAPDNPSIIVFPANSPAPAWMTPYLETAVLLATGPDINGTPAFVAYKITTPPAIEPTWETAVNFGSAITLNGYEVSGAVSGEMMQLTLFWQVNGNLAANFTPFIHLEDRWGDRWSQVEPFAYPAAQWAEGEQIIQHVKLPVPPGTPIGDYQVQIGLFNPDDGSRLARFDENGRFAGSTFVIADIPITAGKMPDTLPQPDFVLDAAVLPGLQLLGYERGANSAATGEAIGVRFWWVATKPVQPLTTRLELLRIDGVGGEILSNAAPVHDTYPFPSWQTPQFVIDPQTAYIPHDLAAGDYLLQMRVLNAIDDTLYTAELGPLTVVATERQFTAPPVEIRLTALFGGEIGLIGYNLRQQTAAEAVLELVWQSAAVPTTDYTVFVHLLTPDGRCDPCVWQQDVMPQQNQYPTGRWAAGEVIVDSYTIPLPPDLAAGIYPIEVGLYIANTGQRLQVVQPNEPPGDVVVLRPLRIEE